MSRHNIFAHTSPGCFQPEYISINREEDGQVTITVRNRRKENFDCGETAEITLSIEEARKLKEALCNL
jgi:hypothetical protein